MASHALIYLLSFVGIWVGSGLAIRSVERISQSLKVSSFAVSFLVLGLFTSISELSVGINSIMENDPEIYVGNLIGASIVLSCWWCRFWPWSAALSELLMNFKALTCRLPWW